MVEATKEKARITLNFGKDNGSFTYSGLLPGCTDMEAYVTALGINMIQRHTAAFIHKTVESRLVKG